MRTTVTLDPDVSAKLKQAARLRGLSFKQVLNESVRRGLQAEDKARAYRIRPRNLGVKPGVDLDRGLALAAGLEDAETIRRLALRK